MKILYILPFVPWQVRVRSFNLIPRLARRHDVHLVCVSNAPPSPEQDRWLKMHCRSVVRVKHSRVRGILNCTAALPTRWPLRLAYCRSKSASEAVRQACNRTRPDVIYVERWRALEIIPKDLDVPLVCDPTDSMTLYNRRLRMSGEWWERLLGWEEYLKFLRLEGELAQSADATVFCSRLDMKCVKRQAPDAHCEVVPNGVDCESFRLKRECEEDPNAIVFTGSFKYRPNVHAAKYFLEEIFPRVRREVPSAKFTAVGNGAKKALTRLRGPDEFVPVDFVPALQPYLANAAVAVAPLTLGSGVSNKIAEAFAVGTAVVATPLACGDLPVRDGEQLLIGRDASSFAEQVITLLQDSDLRSRLTRSARRLVEEAYDWDIVAAQMERLLQSVAGGKAHVEQQLLVPTS